MTLLEYAMETGQSVVSFFRADAVASAPMVEAGDGELSAALHSSLAALSGERDVRPPKLVVVGTQSSGKSSLLNALVGVELLPVGESMTTRAAVQVQLVRDDVNAARVEFGEYAGGEWVPSCVTALSSPPAPAQQAFVRDTITQRTRERLGGANGILTDGPICLRLYSPQVPNTCFVDLPGITMTPLLSEGQPPDMCEQIRNLILSQIDERTIVLMVCAARVDLEADAAVELCKSACNGRNTIGCLTKVDLCNEPAVVERYVCGLHATDLSVEHGYFAVVCKNRDYEAERLFFSSYPRLGASKRAGTLQLARFANEALNSTIRRTLPALQQELAEVHEQSLSRLRHEFATEVPCGENERVHFCHDLVLRFALQLHSSVSARRPDADVGRRIRDIFTDMRCAARDVRPFARGGAVTDEDIFTAVRNAEGWSMMSPIPPVEMVEYFLRHEEKRPIQALLPACVDGLHAVVECIREEARAVAGVVFKQYDAASDYALRRLDQKLEECKREARAGLQACLDVEEAYIFTDNTAFEKLWLTTTHRGSASSYPEVLRGVLASYYELVVETVCNHAPKIIVMHVRRVLKEMQTYLVRDLDAAAVASLLTEDEEVERARARLTERVETTGRCLELLARTMK